MNESHDNENMPTNLLEKSHQLFTEQCEGLDVATRNRLRLMRRAALNTTSPPHYWPVLWPTGAAALAIAFGMFWWAPSTTTLTEHTIETYPSQTVETILLEGEDPELYTWLGEAPIAINTNENEGNSR